jgi:predicted NAD/FAD-binding protein
MCAAIWSSSLESIKSFPLRFFLQFFMNHGLLNIAERPQWYTLIGGSRSYIAPLTAGFKEHIHLNSAVQSVAKVDGGYRINSVNDAISGVYDEVIFACHSDQALKMLAQPTAEQKDVLGAIPYSNNEVVLHTDSDILPNRPLAWASWNYMLDGKPGEEQSPATLTYDMNILQCIESDTTFCVTLNATDKIDKDSILRTFNYAHPQFSEATIQAQQKRHQICGKDGLHFCGAYWYNGFHEDGVRSALDVCNRFGEALF